MQIICSGVDGSKVQLWEAITLYRIRILENGQRGRIEMGAALLKTVLCQKGGTLPLRVTLQNEAQVTSVSGADRVRLCEPFNVRL